MKIKKQALRLFIRYHRKYIKKYMREEREYLIDMWKLRERLSWFEKRLTN